MIDESNAWTEEDMRDFAAASQGHVGDSAQSPWRRDNMSDSELARELDEWQALGVSGLEMFPYEEDAEE